MKAVTRLHRVAIVVSSVFFVLTTAGLYLSTRAAVFDELDESLHWRYREVETALRNGSLQPDAAGGLGVYGSTEWVELHAWHGTPPSARLVYHSLLLPEPGHNDEFLDYRRVTGFVHIDGVLYELSVTRSVLEWQEVLTVFNISAVAAVLLLLLVLSISFTLTFRRLMAPLFDMVDRLSGIRSGGDLRTVFPHSSIDEFNRLADALNAMLRTVEAAFDEQKTFLQNASHELQTPLTVLRQQTESLLRDPGVSEFTLRHIADIQETIARIGRLNNALLLISRIENRQFLAADTVDMGALVQEVCGELREPAELRSLRIDEQLGDATGVCIQGNRDLLHILVYNLLQNAVKFAPEHSTIRVALRHTDAVLLLSVSNEGVIPPQRRGDLFRRFRKVSSSWSDSPGLGLSIVRDICTLHGFSCELAPDADERTTFLVRLPLSRISP